MAFLFSEVAVHSSRFVGQAFECSNAKLLCCWEALGPNVALPDQLALAVTSEGMAVEACKSSSMMNVLVVMDDHIVLGKHLLLLDMIAYIVDT